MTPVSCHWLMEHPLNLYITWFLLKLTYCRQQSVGLCVQQSKVVLWEHVLLQYSVPKINNKARFHHYYSRYWATCSTCNCVVTIFSLSLYTCNGSTGDNVSSPWIQFLLPGEQVWFVSNIRISYVGEHIYCGMTWWKNYLPIRITGTSNHCSTISRWYLTIIIF